MNHPPQDVQDYNRLLCKVEAPMRRRWRMQRGAEMKKQGEMRPTGSSATMFLRAKLAP